MFRGTAVSTPIDGRMRVPRIRACTASASVTRVPRRQPNRLGPSCRVPRRTQWFSSACAQVPRQRSRHTVATVASRVSSALWPCAREAVVATIEASALRGRGGAGFPAGTKWRSTFAQPRQPKFVVCNADEGDPGAYIDRLVLEDDPYCVLEAMMIAAYAIGAEQGYVYVRREYPDAYASLDRAGREPRANGLLGQDALGHGRGFDIRVLRGKGSYVCGEETALLNAIEGRRPEVRARPPFPASHGLFGSPTLVHNVETLASVPWILRREPSRTPRWVAARAEAPRCSR